MGLTCIVVKCGGYVFRWVAVGRITDDKAGLPYGSIPH